VFAGGAEWIDYVGAPRLPFSWHLFIASLIPAWRAAQLDPANALRAE
jgi:hypothetical protein